MIFSGLVHLHSQTYQECHFLLPIIETFWYVYKSNPVVGSILAGMINYQPPQAWMISLTGLTAWVITLWSLLTTNQPVVSTDNQLSAHLAVLHCQVCCITFLALGIPLI